MSKERDLKVVNDRFGTVGVGMGSSADVILSGVGDIILRRQVRTSRKGEEEFLSVNSREGSEVLAVHI